MESELFRFTFVRVQSPNFSNFPMKLFRAAGHVKSQISNILVTLMTHD